MVCITDKFHVPAKKTKANSKKTKKPVQRIQQFNMAGKSPEDVLPYLISGEADDLPPDLINKV
ncbi:MAG: hypothetical protein ACYCWE_11945 [Eubacteriales bacterium]